MFLVFRRIGIIPVAVFVANLVLTIVNHQLSFVCLCDWHASFNCCLLRLVHTGGSLVTFANYSPSLIFSMRYMNVLFHRCPLTKCSLTGTILSFNERAEPVCKNFYFAVK